MNIGMIAMQKQFDQLERFVDDFQQINMRIRTSKIPVVVATQGYVFGGGCEIAEPENMGNDINTASDEVFPYSYNEDVLFFSSNRKLVMVFLIV